MSKVWRTEYKLDDKGYSSPNLKSSWLDNRPGQLFDYDTAMRYLWGDNKGNTLNKWIFRAINTTTSEVVYSPPYLPTENNELEIKSQHKEVPQVSHYQRLTPEPIEVLEAWAPILGWNKTSAIKYLSRAGAKDGATETEDLNKALNYINRAIAAAEGRKAWK